MLSINFSKNSHQIQSKFPEGMPPDPPKMLVLHISLTVRVLSLLYQCTLLGKILYPPLFGYMEMNYLTIA